jgi:hypothetical protein
MALPKIVVEMCICKSSAIIILHYHTKVVDGLSDNEGYQTGKKWVVTCPIPLDIP